MKTFGACALGLLSVVAAGCEITRPLGDLESDAGAGGDATETGGHAGASTGGAASGGSTTGGAATGGANGGSTTGGAATGGANGGSTTGGASTGGANGGSTTGGAATGGGGGGVHCFSPDDSPALALEPDAVGCACDPEREAEACVGVSRNQGLHLVAMVCEGGRWISVEDGPCEPGPEPWCMIDGRVFKKGSPVPLDFLCDVCWSCDIDEPACLLIDCAPDQCPSGTAKGERCRSCGLRPGGCDIVEHGCFGACPDGESCDFGTCSDGVCSVGPCI